MLPRVIEVWGADVTFETLVKESVRARGVTVKSALESLMQNKLVRMRDDGRVELTADVQHSKEKSGLLGTIQAGLEASARLLGTVEHNIRAQMDGRSKRFERANWTHRINPDDRAQIEQELRDYLIESEEEIRRIVKRYEDPVEKEGQVTAGVGAYYFEIDPKATHH